MSIKMRILILFYSLVFLLVSSYTLAQREYQSYTNDRFHFSIDYPAALFTPEPSPTNGDGKTFSNDEASLTAWGNQLLAVILTIPAWRNEHVAKNVGCECLENGLTAWEINY